MNYQVLARKWRPRSFQDMIGQEHILRMLVNALEQKRLHHAYLFTGTRGVGKTTLARILAKCLNCDTGITPQPCGQCPTCQAIDAGQFLDLYEVDAASRTKVEDTRELLDNVLYEPTQGRYKIYLIDEVHMLSNHSFNALLKTLEEPPPHVIFILATTDPKRLPITILSRCLQFYLKRITPELIARHLEHICTQENVQYDVPALEQLAKAADGSMRDALSILDQAIAYGKHAVTTKEVQAMLGCMAQEDLLPLLDALSQRQAETLFNHAAQLAQRAPDYQHILEDLISLLHQIAMAQFVPQTAAAPIADLAKRFTPDEVQLYYQIALLGRRDLAFTPSPQQGFEMTLLRLLAFQPGQADAKPISSSKPIAAVSAHKTEKPATSVAAPAPAPTAAAAPAAAAAPSLPQTAEWRTILPQLGLTGMSQALASNCSLVTLSDNKVVLALTATHQPMLNQKLKDRLTEALSSYFKKPIQLDITITADDIPTPAKQHASEKKQQLDTAKQSMLQDSRVQQLIDMYDATVEISLLS